ncbi:hypothetical protein ABBQ38_006285 [Trebouxia sp. C0009 RCD-2024]
MTHPSEELSKPQGKALAPERPQLEERDGSPARASELAAYRKKIYMLNAKLMKRKTCTKKQEHSRQ